MPKKAEIIGKRFGRLTVLEESENRYRKWILWRCKCDCGNICEVRTQNLLSGKTKSCGCLQKDKARSRWTTHGLSRTRLNGIWKNMNQRCTNPKTKRFKSYGGRGITVCDEWRNSFETFYEWAMANGYSDDMTIDRIDVNGNYCPGNCRWITRAEQNSNKSDNVILEAHGQKHTVSEWAKITGINRDTIYSRLLRGYSATDALKEVRKYERV